MLAATDRLRKHADYQRVYKAGRKQFVRNIAYFYALRLPQWAPPAGPDSLTTSGPRVGLTVPKALGKAVIRNRIKRRLREAVRHALPLLQAPVDVVLHPRRIVIEMEFTQLEREVAGLFRSVQTACDRALTQQQAPQQAGVKQTGLKQRGSRKQPDLKQPAPPAAAGTLPS
jgi:ribonuclease P protein component